MRWDDFRRSSNVEDDRGESSGGGFNLPGGAHGLGIGTIIILGLVGWALGIDPSVLINGAQILSGGGPVIQQSGPPPADDAQTAATKDFVAAVLGDTEDRWTDIFTAMGRTYHPPRLRLFSGAIDGGCGMAQSAMGPFYCPQDKDIYLDLSFFKDMQDKFNACSSDKACRFSEAYVIAHEVGHHVQDELGTLPRVMAAQQAASSRTQVNAMQVRVELQADCYAGIWANHAQQKHSFLDAGDVDQALQTASAIGDDRLQKQAQGYVVPDSFTHGTSEQRKRWFLNGFNSGQLSACDTMSAATL
ncbi:MAG: neutral zinc metallopeptidase [Xanthobacteraceae bacterium]